MTLSFKPIGFIKSCYKEKFGTPRQPGLVPISKAELKINRELQPEQALDGLNGFSHIWLLFVFHENHISHYHAKVHPPLLKGKAMGLFATRSPHRPNSIGLSLVKLEKIEGDVVHMSGVDLIEGTPILDIKPYLPGVEAISEATVSPWYQEIQKLNFKVVFSNEAEEQIQEWQEFNDNYNLKELIIETLSHNDPRPLVYRDERPEGVAFREVHVMRLFDRDVHFKFIEDQVEVVQVSVI